MIFERIFFKSSFSFSVKILKFFALIFFSVRREVRPAGDVDPGLQQDRDRPHEGPHQRPQDHLQQWRRRLQQQVSQTLSRVAEIVDGVGPTRLVVAEPGPAQAHLVVDVTHRLQSSAAVVVVVGKAAEVQHVVGVAVE